MEEGGTRFVFFLYLSICRHSQHFSTLSTCQNCQLTRFILYHVNIVNTEVTLARAPPGLPCQHSQQCHHYQLISLSTCHHCQNCELVNLATMSTYSPGKSPWPGLPPACPVCSPPSTFGLFPRSTSPYRYHLSLLPKLRILHLYTIDRDIVATSPSRYHLSLQPNL